MSLAGDTISFMHRSSSISCTVDIISSNYWWRGEFQKSVASIFNIDKVTREGSANFYSSFDGKESETRQDKVSDFAKYAKSGIVWSIHIHHEGVWSMNNKYYVYETEDR